MAHPFRRPCASSHSQSCSSFLLLFVFFHEHKHKQFQHYNASCLSSVATTNGQLTSTLATDHSPISARQSTLPSVRPLIHADALLAALLLDAAPSSLPSPGLSDHKSPSLRRSDSIWLAPSSHPESHQQPATSPQLQSVAASPTPISLPPRHPHRTSVHVQCTLLHAVCITSIQNCNIRPIKTPTTPMQSCHL